MIVVDTSAPIAIILGEPAGPLCLAALETETEILMSAGTLAELLIVAARLGITEQVTGLVHRGGFKIIAVTGATAATAGRAYKAWGKGFHPAGLNFGDCFAYALAEQYACGLLFVGDDFARTDVQRAL